MRWGAILAGEETDIEDWIELLKQPFDPWVEKSGKDLIFRSDKFNNIHDPNEARAAVAQEIALLNGAITLYCKSSPVVMQNLIEFDENGQYRRHAFGQLNAILARTKLKAVAFVVGPDVKVPQGVQPSPSTVQLLSENRSANIDIVDAITYFGRADNWFDLYKCIECIKSTGLLNNVIIDDNICSKTTFDNTNRTANYHRHARADPPKKPVPFLEARETIRRVLERVVELSRQRE